MATVTVDQSIANMPAFLDLVAWSEGTSTEDITRNSGYDVIVTGEEVLGQRVHEEVFTDYATHPFCVTPARAPMIVRVGPPELESTASGRYQLLARYFLDYKASLGLKDFSPLSQDLIAIEQIKERRTPSRASAFYLIGQGNIAVAIGLCSGIWASFPANSYAQGGKSLAALMQQWSLMSSKAA
jgi:muramidase (phage lysozyme)